MTCVECGRTDNCDTLGHGVYCIECLQNPMNYARFIGMKIPQYYVDDARERMSVTKYKLVKFTQRELPPLVVDDPGVKPEYLSNRSWSLFNRFRGK